MNLSEIKLTIFFITSRGIRNLPLSFSLARRGVLLLIETGPSADIGNDHGLVMTTFQLGLKYFFYFCSWL